MISFLILTKNEERNIGRAIRSALPLVKELRGEIIVLDSGSTDRTVEIARALGAKTYFRAWTSYPDQLNFGLTLCKGPWIFVLDADEEISEELKESILRELRNPRYEVYEVCRRVYYLGKFLKYTWYPEWRVRLFKKGSVKISGEIHESIEYIGKAGKLRGDLYHYSFQNLLHHIEKSIHYAKIFADIEAKSGKKVSLLKLLGSPLWYFVKLFFLKRGFLDGKRGLIASAVTSFYGFMKYAFLYEKSLAGRLFQQNESKEDREEEEHPKKE